MIKSQVARRILAPVLIALVVLFSFVPAFSSGIINPVDVRIFGGMSAGQNATVQVTLSGAGPVVLSSSPAGIVSYSTTIPTSSATLSVPVNSSASGPVTVILTSSGSGQKAAMCLVEQEGQGN
jgi:hypothetical protein